MILNRMAVAIREQNWFTVVLEVLIVVVGIVIGLQVDDWNQQRHDRAEEQLYLDRLFRDMESSLASQKLQIEAAQALFENSREIANALRAGDLGNMSEDEFADRLSKAWGFPPLTLVTSTMNELTSTGKIALLRSNILREEIGRFVERYEDQEIYFQIVSGISVDASSRIIRSIQLVWDGDSAPRITTSFEELLDDPSISSAIDQQTQAYWAFSRDQRKVHSMTLEFYDVLVKAIDQSITTQ